MSLHIKTIGSVCSGIEAASVAWKNFGVQFQWFSEISSFPCQLLEQKYPDIPNVGDMTRIPELLKTEAINAPDLICGGTPCQAFSLAGWKNGLKDDRGNLTLRFMDIIEANDAIRLKRGESRSIVFWENVEGVLSDKTNAFGCFVSSLAGLSQTIERAKWPSAGIVRGPVRNVAWRVIDAKFFGLPQQRKRLYLLAGGKNFTPEKVLFESHKGILRSYPENKKFMFQKNGHSFEIFRSYTDCLYSSYGTKWNGNAAAYNGSLYVVQDGRIRRFSPLEAERLMGFPDNYTLIPQAKRTTRYQAIGNSWAIPVIKWLGERIFNGVPPMAELNEHRMDLLSKTGICEEQSFVDLSNGIVTLSNGQQINCSSTPENPVFASVETIVSPEADEDIYISPVGCSGIVRRKRERRLSMNARLEKVLSEIASQMPLEEIEKASRIQKRGRFSQTHKDSTYTKAKQRKFSVLQPELF